MHPSAPTEPQGLTKITLYESLGGKCYVCSTNEDLAMHHMGYIEDDDLRTVRQKTIAYRETPDRFRCLCRTCNTNIEWYYDICDRGLLERASEVAESMRKYRMNGLTRKKAVLTEKQCAVCRSVITEKGRWRVCSETCRLKLQRDYINQRDRDAYTYIKVLCPICNEMFTKTDTDTQQTCGKDECKKEFVKRRARGPAVERECVMCGAAFEATANTVKKTCSEKCSLALKSQNTNSYDKSRIVWITETCPICRSSFTKTTRQVQKTCGAEECKREWQGIRTHGPKITRNCLVCGDPFTTREKSTKKTCDDTCAKTRRLKVRRDRRRTRVNKYKHSDAPTHTPRLTNADLHHNLGGKCVICDSNQNLAVHHMGYKMGEKISPIQKKNAMTEDPDRFTCLCRDCNTHIEWYYKMRLDSNLGNASKLAHDMREYRANGLTRKDTKPPKSYCVECHTLITEPNRWRACSDECRRKFNQRRNNDLAKKGHTYVEGTCPICKARFIRTTKQQRKTCGKDECRRQLIRLEKIGPTITRQCKVCTKSFETTENSLKKTCGIGCKKERQRLMLNYRRKHKNEYVTEACPICSNDFERTIRQRQKTCGNNECVREWTRRYLSGTKTSRRCVVCSTSFVVTENSNKITCSKPCTAKRNNDIRRARRRAAVAQQHLD